MLRRVVAALGHAPGLWLLFGETLPKPLVRKNLVAIGMTLAAMLASGLLAPQESWRFPVFTAWLVGHLAWGAYLQAKIPT